MEKICNKKILAESLLEWTLGSTTTFLKSEENQVLAEKAAKLGIELPSPDLAAFETIYCEVDKFNLNGVKIPRKVAEKGVKTLIGKQVNWNHEGAHQICGYIIDSFIKDDKIYIDGILFKSLFKTEFDEVIQLFAEGKLFVSFELWNRKEDGTIIVKDLGNGQRELTEMVAHGCALLLIDQETGKPIPPACPRAKVQKLLASEQVIIEAEEIINSVSEQDERLVYAELATTIEELKPCSKCICFEKEGKNIMAEEVKIEEVKAEEVKPEEVKIEEPKAEEAQVTPEPAQVAEPIPETEQKPAEQAQVVEQPAEVPSILKIVTEETVERIEIPNETGYSVSRRGIRKCTHYYSDGKEEISTEEFVIVDTYSLAQLEEKVNAAKAEKDTEIANLKTELGTKNQEIEELKKPKVEVAKEEVKEEQPVLEVGNTSTKTTDKYVERRKKINKKAYGHENNGY